MGTGGEFDGPAVGGGVARPLGVGVGIGETGLADTAFVPYLTGVGRLGGGGGREVSVGSTYVASAGTTGAGGEAGWLLDEGSERFVSSLLSEDSMSTSSPPSPPAG